MSVVSRGAGVISGIGLAGIGLMHLAWAIGISWPAPNRARLAEAVVGGDEMPGPVPCVTVGLGLLGAGAVVGGVGGTGRLVTLAHLGIASGLVVRGVAGGVAAAKALDLPGMHPRFAELDRRVYRPLCLALGSMVAVAVAGRR